MAWVHKSAADLKNAGYVFRFTSNCRSSKCRRMIYFYATPKGGIIPVDPGTFQPHFETCPDPQKFRKKGANRNAEEVAASEPDTSRPTDPLRRALARPLPELPQASLFDAGFTGRRIRKRAAVH